MGKPELGSFISETARRTAAFDLPAPRILMHMVLRYTSNSVKVDDTGFQSIFLSSVRKVCRPVGRKQNR